MARQDPPPFEFVFSKYKERIFRLICRMMGDEEEAKDLVSEVFLAAYKAYHRFRGESDVYSWLYRIAINRTLNRIKRKSRIVSLDNPLGKDKRGEDIFHEVVSSRDGPEGLQERKEVIEAVRQAIARLPSKYREVIVLREIENLSYEEIAATLEISTETVGVRLYRAREKLRRLIKK